MVTIKMINKNNISLIIKYLFFAIFGQIYFKPIFFRKFFLFKVKFVYYLVIFQIIFINIYLINENQWLLAIVITILKYIYLNLEEEKWLLLANKNYLNNIH